MNNKMIAVLLFFVSATFGHAASLNIIDDGFQYSSEYTDSESKLQYLNARYYAPAEMRFISRDTYKLMNRYTYAGDNPVMNEDPSGHKPSKNRPSSGDDLASGGLTLLEAGMSIVNGLFVYSNIHEVQAMQVGQNYRIFFTATVCTVSALLMTAFFMRINHNALTENEYLASMGVGLVLNLATRGMFEILRP